MTMTKTTDAVIDEIHQTRRAISDRFGGDLEAIAEDAARRQAASKRSVWRPKSSGNSSELADEHQSVDVGESSVTTG